MKRYQDWVIKQRELRISRNTYDPHQTPNQKNKTSLYLNMQIQGHHI